MEQFCKFRYLINKKKNIGSIIYEKKWDANMLCSRQTKGTTDGSKLCPLYKKSLNGSKFNKYKVCSNVLQKLILSLLIAVVLFSSFSCGDNTNQTTATLIPYRRGDKWGFCDSNKKIVIEPIYDHVEPFSDGLAVILSGKKQGYIDKKGLWVIQIEAPAREFSEELAVVKTNDKYGYIDTKGNMVIQPIYDDAYSFSDGLAVVRLKDKWGYINTKGEMVIQIQGGSFSEGLASAMGSNMKLGYIDTKGNWVIEPIYNGAYPFSGGIARVAIGEAGVGGLRK